MSISGVGLYDDDTGADVRSTFRELVADGSTAAQATDALVAQWGDALEDYHQVCAFWLALADTESRTGRLEERVRDRALGLMASGEDLARFEHDLRLYRKRQSVLRELRDRLTAPQRAPIRIRRPFRSVSPVEVGDVFAFALPSGRTVWLRCIAVQGDERDSSPTVELLDWDGPAPPRDPRKVSARRALSHQTDLLWLVRYPKDPDPADRIQIVAKGTPVSRHPLPAVVMPWTDLERVLARSFGI